MTSEIAENVLSRYYRPGETRWEDIAARVGGMIGGAAVTTAMNNRAFIPASPFLINAGTDKPQLFSCFVLPLEDSLGSIFSFYDKSAKIFKSSGGVGANWSKLRPVGSPLSGGGTTSGVVSFMEIFNVIIEKVKQGGIKKGAAMCTLNIDHPEIESFIRMKLEKGTFENFNISPSVTDEFMNAAICGSPKEKALFDLIVDCTHNCSEPGMLWIDIANKNCSTPGMGLYESPNPCSERYLFDYESCCLSGINVSYFVKKSGSPEVDYAQLGKIVRMVVRFLDEAIDLNDYPLPEIKTATQYTRRIGLYPLGVADALIKARLGYNTQEARTWCYELWEFINRTAWDESVKLGEKKGKFPAYEHRNPDLVPEGARNAAVTCVAPGGTTSLIAGVNYGIEPYFSFVSKRAKGAGQGRIVCTLFEEALREVCSSEIEYNSVIDHCGATGTIQDVDWLPEWFRRVFVSALDIHWRDHIDMQSTFQELCIDGTISKTINLPESSTKEDIRSAYIYAWQKQCRGITFYREGTRDGVYTLEKKVDSDATGEVLKKTGPGYIVPRKAPAIRYIVNVGCGKMGVIVVGDPETAEPIEVWMIPISGGGCAGHCSGEGRSISNALQWGAPPDIFISSLGKVVCKACMDKEKGKLDGKSCPDAMGRKLREYLKDSDLVKTYIRAYETGRLGEAKLTEVKEPTVRAEKSCPRKGCGGELIFTEGCSVCPECGYSKCG